jgi:hypothetical protein
MNDKFNLERAIAGEPIEKEDGTTVSFVAYIPTAKADRQLIVQDGDDVLAYCANGRYITPFISSHFDLRMKSMLKQIDWSKLPEDTVISTPEGDRHISKCSKNSTLVLTYPEGKSSFTCGLRELEEHSKDTCYLVEQQPWTVWLGGECPIPDGLEFEYMIHDDPRQVIVCKESASAYLYLWKLKRIYAYRPTGKVLDGWKL